MTVKSGVSSMVTPRLKNCRREPSVDSTAIVIDHYNIQPTFDIYADVEQRDLGGVADQIHNMIKRQKNCPAVLSSMYEAK
jgi:hypothetical protein